MIFFSFIISIMLMVLLVNFIFYLMSISVGVDFESTSSYECGFDPLSHTRNLFSYRFFLISILFLIFDVEIALMLPIPYFVSLGGIFIFFLFIAILIIGLMYEYYYGSLDWL